MSFIDTATTVYDDATGFPARPRARPHPRQRQRPVQGPRRLAELTFGGKNINGVWHFIANDYYPADNGTIESVGICIPAAVTTGCYPNCDHSTIAPC
jgi:hypothetical protein